MLYAAGNICRNFFSTLHTAFSYASTATIYALENPGLVGSYVGITALTCGYLARKAAQNQGQEGQPQTFNNRAWRIVDKLARPAAGVAASISLGLLFSSYANSEDYISFETLSKMHFN